MDAKRAYAPAAGRADALRPYGAASGPGSPNCAWRRGFPRSARAARGGPGSRECPWRRQAFPPARGAGARGRLRAAARVDAASARTGIAMGMPPPSLGRGPPRAGAGRGPPRGAGAARPKAPLPAASAGAVPRAMASRPYGRRASGRAVGDSRIAFGRIAIPPTAGGPDSVRPCGARRRRDVGQLGPHWRKAASWAAPAQLGSGSVGGVDPLPSPRTGFHSRLSGRNSRPLCAAPPPGRDRAERQKERSISPPWREQCSRAPRASCPLPTFLALPTCACRIPAKSGIFTSFPVASWMTAAESGAPDTFPTSCAARSRPNGCLHWYEHSAHFAENYERPE